MNAYVAAKVFRALQKYGPINGADLAKIMKRPASSVQQCIERLRVTGRAENLGVGRGSIWIAIGENIPVDGRGAHPNSTAVLFKHQKAIVRRRDLPRPCKTTAIEAALGWGCERAAIQGETA